MDTAPPSGAHEEEVRSSSSVTAAARGEQIRFCVIITVTEGSCVHQPSACPQALAFILQHEAKCSRKRGSMGPEPTAPQTPDLWRRAVKKKTKPRRLVLEKRRGLHRGTLEVPL